MTFYNELQSYVKKAKLNEKIELLSFDFQQVMPLPHIPYFINVNFRFINFVFIWKSLTNHIITCTTDQQEKKDKIKLLVSLTIFLKIYGRQV